MSKAVVILPAPIVIGTGNFLVTRVSLSTLKRTMAEMEVTNFSGHATGLALGYTEQEIAAVRKARPSCEQYDIAYVLQPRTRLDFGVEYTLEDILEIGVDVLRIEHTR